MSNNRKQAFVNQAEVEEEGLEDLPEGEEEDEFDDEDEFPLEFEDDDDDGDGDGDADMNEEILSSFLTTEEGDNIATVLEQGFANIQKTITIQNQILVKILSQLSNKSN